jgi:hypothetical protein
MCNKRKLIRTKRRHGGRCQKSRAGTDGLRDHFSQLISASTMQPSMLSMVIVLLFCCSTSARAAGQALIKVCHQFEMQQQQLQSDC